MIFPVEILNKIFYYTDNINFILPFQNYIYKTTIIYLLRNYHLIHLISNKKYLLFKYLVDINYTINWNSLIYQNLPEEFMRRFYDFLDWKCISQFVEISDSFKREFSNYLDWFYLSNRQLSEDIIREFKDKVNWIKISEKSILSENFIREHKNYVNWDIIFMYQYDLSEKFIEEFIYKSDIKSIIIHQLVSEKIIRKYLISNQLNFDDICYSRCKLSEEFIEEFSNNITDWNSLIISQNLSEDIIRKYKHHITDLYELGTEYLYGIFELSDEFIEEFKDLLFE